MNILFGKKQNLKERNSFFSTVIPLFFLKEIINFFDLLSKCSNYFFLRKESKNLKLF